MQMTELPLSWPARALTRLTGRQGAAKLPLLAAIRWQVRNARAIIVPERTSAALRWMGWRRPLIHFRHGAGDRAPASEARLKAFDVIVVPGHKDITRATAQGIDRTRLRSTGYVKLDYLDTAAAGYRRMFDGSRPVVLYNPHFAPRISSIGIAREVIRRFAAQDRYALIYAPHVRASDDLSAAERASWESLAVPGRIAIDLGSSQLVDMSYANEADIYLGDMSSQLYEFIARPRPAAFLNAHGADWRDDPRYAGWHLGEVAAGPQDVLAAIDRAVLHQPGRQAAQQAAVALAFGNYHGAVSRAVEVLNETLSLA